MSSTERISSPREGSTTDLIGGLIADTKDLVVAHGERMKLEVKGELHALKDTMKLVGIAVGAVVLGGLLAGQAIALGITAATGMPLWAAYAIVAVIAAVGGVLAYRRRSPAEDRDLVPERSLDAASRDAKMIADAVTH